VRASDWREQIWPWECGRGNTIRSSLPEKTHSLEDTSQCHCNCRCLLRVQFIAIQGSANQVENNTNDNNNFLAQRTIYSLTGINQALLVDIYQLNFPCAITAKVKSVLASLLEYMLLSVRQEICERYFSVTTGQTGSMDNTGHWVLFLTSSYSQGWEWVEPYLCFPHTTAWRGGQFSPFTFTLTLCQRNQSVEFHKPTGAAPRAAMLLCRLLHKRKAIYLIF